jgi:hypothetical protein
MGIKRAAASSACRIALAIHPGTFHNTNENHSHIEEAMDEAFPEDLHLAGSPRAQHTLLVAALLHLMSHYTANGGRAGSRDGPCIDLATVIERHLDALAHLPDADPVLRATCEQLSVKWATRVDRAPTVGGVMRHQVQQRRHQQRVLGAG